MALHRAFHWRIESTVPLPELPPAGGEGPPDLLFTVEGSPPPRGEEAWTVLSRLPDGRPWILWSREGEARTLRFPGLAEFVVEGDGRSVLGRPVGALPAETLRHLFLDTVLPCVLHHRGHGVLHGSAVEVDGRAVAFVGDSGAGKSTLAAAFASRGHPCLGDDALLLEESGTEVRVVPAYPGVRLWPDSPSLPRAAGSPVAHYTTKVRVDPSPPGGPPATDPLPLHRLHLLSLPSTADPSVRIEPVSRRDAVVALLARSYFLDPGDTGRMGEEFLRWVESPALSRVRGLHYPRSADQLPRVLDAVLAEAEE